MFICIPLDKPFFQSFGLHPARNVPYQNPHKKPQPTYAQVQKINLVPASFGHAILINGVVADAILENIIFHRIADFVQVVQFFIFIGIAVQGE